MSKGLVGLGQGRSPEIGDMSKVAGLFGIIVSEVFGVFPIIVAFFSLWVIRVQNALDFLEIFRAHQLFKLTRVYGFEIIDKITVGWWIA